MIAERRSQIPKPKMLLYIDRNAFIVVVARLLFGIILYNNTCYCRRSKSLTTATIPIHHIRNSYKYKTRNIAQRNKIRFRRPIGIETIFDLMKNKSVEDSVRHRWCESDITTHLNFASITVHLVDMITSSANTKVKMTKPVANNSRYQLNNV